MLLPLDKIENHVEAAANEVERGRTELGVAVRYKVILFDVCIHLFSDIIEM